MAILLFNIIYGSIYNLHNLTPGFLLIAVYHTWQKTTSFDLWKSKLKGGRGEREFAALCREEGYNNVQRGQQFQGGADSPDDKRPVRYTCRGQAH